MKSLEVSPVSTILSPLYLIILFRSFREKDKGAVRRLVSRRVLPGLPPSLPGDGTPAGPLPGAGSRSYPNNRSWRFSPSFHIFMLSPVGLA